MPTKIEIKNIKKSFASELSDADIKALIALQDNPDQSCKQADTIARARLAEVELRIRHLQSLQAELQAMIGRGCRQRVSKCRVIEGLIGSPA